LRGLGEGVQAFTGCLGGLL